jgi:predicted anti-sigma-YlaC factor YlaD
MHPSEQTISEYVDGELAAAERAEVQHHLDTCPACAALAADFGRLTRAAGALEPLAPPPAVWPRVTDALRRSRTRGRLLRWTSLGALAAAAVLVIAIAAGVRWRTELPPSVASVDGVAPVVNAELLEMERHYDAAFKDLEQIATTERAVLGDTTGATISQSLALVDRAIVESRAAVAEEPSNEPAQQSLIESFRMKLALLQETVALINELRQTQTDQAPVAPGS